MLGNFQLAAGGCSRPAYLLITVEDPDVVATGFERIALGEERAGMESTRPDSHTFPLTVTAVRNTPGEVTLWVEARAADDTVVGRGKAEGRFSRQETSTAVAVLARACEGDGACDDAVFCNGVETCVEGGCTRGVEPCLPSPITCVDVACVEAASACTVTPMHDRCEPLAGPNGPEATYCDARIGCVPGDPCDVEGESCPRVQPCDAVRTCLSGRCIPQTQVAVDDDNPCTIDYCDNELGVVHVADPRVNGNYCELSAAEMGI